MTETTASEDSANEPTVAPPAPQMIKITILRRCACCYPPPIDVEIPSETPVEQHMRVAVETAARSGASLDGASLDGASLVRARLDGASLDGASLDGATPRRRQPRRRQPRRRQPRRRQPRPRQPRRRPASTAPASRLDGASLDGASLDGARLDGASLVRASLVRASLDDASLDGARLDGASLVRASLDGASLVRASLDGARLDGARLDGARLDGASLVRASLDGARLVRASLDGARLDGARLDGARLDGARLDGASLDGIKNDVWAVLLHAQPEVAALLTALRAGKIDGSVYRRREGTEFCGCLVGSLEIAYAQRTGVSEALRDANTEIIPGLKRDGARPAERWFLAIKPGNTPENHTVARLTEKWILEFMQLVGIRPNEVVATAPPAPATEG
jgi:uncharacterized protein YjbI with pentapeptide repeats